MSNLMAGSIGGQFHLLPSNGLQVLSLVTNYKCNLSCRYCYLQPSHDNSKDNLNRGEWLKLLGSVLSDLNPSVISFAGKEVFLDQTSVDIFFDSVNLRDQLQHGIDKTKIGIITNGTLIEKYRQKLIQRNPDYFDLSIDGVPEVHNGIRGRRAFQMLEPNLRWLQDTFPGRIWILHTLLESNVRTLPAFIEFYDSKYNVQNFSIGFYRPMPYTDQSLALTRDEYHEIVDSVIPRLSRIDLKRPVQLIIELDQSEEELLDTFTTSGWVDPVKPISSVAHEFDNGMTLRLNVARVPVGLWRAVRISPEGYWISADDLMRVREYEKICVAKVRDEEYDAVRLYEKGLQRSRTLYTEAHSLLGQ